MILLLINIGLNADNTEGYQKVMTLIWGGGGIYCCHDSNTVQIIMLNMSPNSLEMYNCIYCHL